MPQQSKQSRFYNSKWSKPASGTSEQQALHNSTINFPDCNSESDTSFDPESEVLDEDEAIKKHETEWVLTQK